MWRDRAGGYEVEVCFHRRFSVIRKRQNKPAGGNRGSVHISIGVFRRGCHSGSVILNEFLDHLPSFQ